ncbi:MAG: Arylsulfatase [Prosthecobacter sp.]|nr:Arylsulfatase [Prosthecobacter sp.]
MSRFLACLLSTFVILHSSFAAEARPNVLFILCDDLRPDALGCYGSKHVKTPNIDRLAKEGVRFANTFCTTSLCSPSRGSILSGLYAHAHGVTNNFTEYPATLRSFPSALHDAGYTTAYFGKYHMGEENDDPRPGYDTFVTHKGQGKYFDTEWNLNGKKREVIKGYYTNVVTDLALDWLKQQGTGKPWCACIGHKAPHSFYTPEPKYEHAFDDVRVPYPATAFMLDDKPAWIKQRLYTWHGIYGPLFEWRKKFPDDSPAAVKDFENMVHGYWGTVLSVDDSVARVRAWLEETKQLDNTLIVFMGDNGLLEGEDGMVDKRTAHEPSLRIPLIVRYPKLTEKTHSLMRGSDITWKVNEPLVVEHQVLTVDMAPSLLELCSAPALPKTHGRSWVKLIQEGRDSEWRQSWFYHYNYEKQFPYTPNVRAIRTDRWKYIHYPHGDGSPDNHMAELYDLEADPGETTNLINKPQHAQFILKLQAELAKLMLATGLDAKTDKMPMDEGVKSALPDAKIR